MRLPCYVIGDATDPYDHGPGIIAHVCNDVSLWGKGFVLAVSQRWRAPERAYRKLGGTPGALKLGLVQFVPVGEKLTVANMVAQRGIYPAEGVAPIRYEALETCLDVVASRALATDAAVHMPRIGCGLAGGTWPRVQEIIHRSLCERDVPVWVYDLPVTGGTSTR